MNVSDYVIILGIGCLVTAYAIKKPKIEAKPKMEKTNDSIDG